MKEVVELKMKMVSKRGEDMKVGLVSILQSTCFSFHYY